MWRQSVRAEASVGTGGCAASVLLDMRKFYEAFRLRLLRDRAAGCAFDAVVTKVCCNVYAGPRMVRFGSLCHSSGFAFCGLPAGCIFSDVWVRVYCLRAFDSFVASHPQVDPDFYVDDLTVGTCGTSKASVAQIVGRAAHDLHQSIVRDLESDVAVEKAAIVASSPDLAVDVSVVMGQRWHFACRVDATLNLGVDFLPGAARVRHGGRRRRAGVQPLRPDLQLWRHPGV